MTEVQIITPQGMFGSSEGEDFIATAMRIIGVGFGDDGDWCAKYGTDVETDVFAMRRYYWDECECGYTERCEAWEDAHPHSEVCYQTELERREVAAGIHYTQSLEMKYEKREGLRKQIYNELAKKFDVDSKYGAAIHCTCEKKAASAQYYASDDHAPSCPIVLPNFLYKPTGFALTWYKYIGRGMEIVAKHPLPADFMQKVFSSHPDGMTVEQAIAKTAEQEERTATAFAAMFAQLGIKT